MDASYIENYSSPFVQNYGPFQSKLAQQQIKDTLDEGGIAALTSVSSKLLPYAKNAIDPIMSKISDVDMTSPNFNVLQQFKPQTVKTFGEEDSDLAEILGQSTANRTLSSQFVRTSTGSANEAADAEIVGGEAADASIGASSILEAGSVIGLPLAIAGVGYLLSNLLEHHSAPVMPTIDMAPSIKF